MRAVSSQRISPQFPQIALYLVQEHWHLEAPIIFPTSLKKQILPMCGCVCMQQYTSPLCQPFPTWALLVFDLL